MGRVGDLTQNRLFNVREGGEDERAQFSLTLDYDADFGTFTSSTGYFTRDTFEYEDSSEFVSFTLMGRIREILRVSPANASAIFFDQTMRDFRELLPSLTAPCLVTAGADEKLVTVSPACSSPPSSVWRKTDEQIIDSIVRLSDKLNRNASFC